MTDRLICSKENPYSKERELKEPNKGWIHEDAKSICHSFEIYGDSEYDDYKCPNCGTKFRKYIS